MEPFRLLTPEILEIVPRRYLVSTSLVRPSVCSSNSFFFKTCRDTKVSLEILTRSIAIYRSRTMKPFMKALYKFARFLLASSFGLQRVSIGTVKSKKPDRLITLFVSWLSVMKLWTCFSALVNSSLRANTATTRAVHPEPYKDNEAYKYLTFR